MTQYAAQILGNIVTWVILGSADWANQNLDGNWVDCTKENGEPSANIGFSYDSFTKKFITPQPFASWSLDANNDWQAPTPKPEGDYTWDEATLAWVEIV